MQAEGRARAKPEVKWPVPEPWAAPVTGTRTAGAGRGAGWGGRSGLRAWTSPLCHPIGGGAVLGESEILFERRLWLQG